MQRNRLGYSLIEMIVVVLLVAVVASIAVPSALKPSPARQVEVAARALTRDLELLRMRAIASKRHVRVRFYVSANFYTAFMDNTAGRSGVEETAEAVHESRLLTRGSALGLPGVELPRNVVFGKGTSTTAPPGFESLGLESGGPVELANGDFLEFDARGRVVPAGSGGVIYLTHDELPTEVAAVTITGASAFRTWVYRRGEWGR